MTDKLHEMTANNLEVVELSSGETEKIVGGASLKSTVMLDSSQKLNINVGTKLQTWEAGLIKDLDLDLTSNDCPTGTCTAEDNTCDCD